MWVGEGAGGAGSWVWAGGVWAGGVMGVGGRGYGRTRGVGRVSVWSGCGCGWGQCVVRICVWGEGVMGSRLGVCEWARDVGGRGLGGLRVWAGGMGWCMCELSIWAHAGGTGEQVRSSVLVAVEES